MHEEVNKAFQYMNHGIGFQGAQGLAEMIHILYK